MASARLERVWMLPPLAAPAAAQRLCAELGLPRVAGEVLVRRGLHNPAVARRFLDAGAADLHDPFLLPDLEAAAHRLARAIQGGERIVVHGDYDADGITGAALLAGALRRLGAQAEPFVPDRIRDGYGVSARLVEHAGAHGVTLLITVDTGSSAELQLRRARELGIDVIVCDHHLFDVRPDGATWLINPQRTDSAYPNAELCGCGVAFKLLCGLARVLERPCDVERELDLVAIALLADQMPVLGENRALVRLGLARMAQSSRPGVRALLASAGLQGQALDASDIAYQIAPRINAAGRIESARTALDLLLTEDPAQAAQLALRLGVLNRQRQALDRTMTDEAVTRAMELLQEGPRASLVLASQDWHVGVVGIGAARLVQRFHVPTVLLSVMGEEARGSARSVPGFDLKQALDGCAGHLTRYGGHAAAAGLTLPARGIAGFTARFEEVAAQMPRRSGQEPLLLDAVLPLGEIDAGLADFLVKLGPFGLGNPQPLFAAYGLRVTAPPSVVGQKHLRLALSEDGLRRGFIGFGLAHHVQEPLRGGSRLDVAFRARFVPNPRFDPWELSVESLRVLPPEAAP